MVLLRDECLSNDSSGGKSFLVGEVVMGLRLAALAAIMEARSAGFPLLRLSAGGGRAWSMDCALLWW